MLEVMIILEDTTANVYMFEIKVYSQVLRCLVPLFSSLVTYSDGLTYMCQYVCADYVEDAKTKKKKPQKQQTNESPPHVLEDACLLISKSVDLSVR